MIRERLYAYWISPRMTVALGYSVLYWVTPLHRHMPLCPL